MMSSQNKQSEHAASLSALMDGDATAADAKALCETWARDEDARADWHLYQLIGDTLRSGDLAQASAHDKKFLDRLGARLALEPVVLAPHQPAAISSDETNVRTGRRRWAAPMAVAAGFMLVAGALLVLQNNGAWDQGGADQVVQASASGKTQPGLTTSAGTVEVATSEAREPVTMATSSGAITDRSDAGNATPLFAYTVDGRVVRDARLERYLQAHKEFRAGTALDLSTGYLRNASFDAQ